VLRARGSGSLGPDRRCRQPATECPRGPKSNTRWRDEGMFGGRGARGHCRHDRGRDLGSGGRRRPDAHGARAHATGDRHRRSRQRRPDEVLRRCSLLSHIRGDPRRRQQWQIGRRLLVGVTGAGLRRCRLRLLGRYLLGLSRLGLHRLGSGRRSRLRLHGRDRDGLCCWPRLRGRGRLGGRLGRRSRRRRRRICERLRSGGRRRVRGRRGIHRRTTGRCGLVRGRGVRGCRRVSLWRCVGRWAGRSGVGSGRRIAGGGHAHSGQNREWIEVAVRFGRRPDSQMDVRTLDLRRSARADGTDRRPLGHGVVLRDGDGAEVRQRYVEAVRGLDRHG
jgi:hypothetical protein